MDAARAAAALPADPAAIRPAAVPTPAPPGANEQGSLLLGVAVADGAADEQGPLLLAVADLDAAECAICLAPKVLSTRFPNPQCPHSYCQECLEGLLAHGASISDRRDGRVAHAIMTVCPQCRRPAPFNTTEVRPLARRERGTNSSMKGCLALGGLVSIVSIAICWSVFGTIVKLAVVVGSD